MKKIVSRLLIVIMGMMIIMNGCTKKENMTSDAGGLHDLYTPSEKYEGDSAISYEQADRKTIDNSNYFTVQVEGERMPYGDVSGETYASVQEQSFHSAKAQPLSTFSLDVDTASYANMRRYLESGIVPPTDAIRIEELLNYFDYQYVEPKEGELFTIDTQLSVCPWNEKNFLLSVGIKAKEVKKEKLPKSNLVFLIDVSGSMDSPEKLPLLQKSFEKLVRELGEDDRVSIVVYASDTGIVLDSAYGNEHDKIISAINHLQAGGSTGGESGIKLAYQLAKKNFREDGNNRVILATDGDFNIGASSAEELENLIMEKRNDGIFLSVIGFGMGNYRDYQMETLADKGNGNYSYIDSEKEAQKVLVDEMAGTLLALAKDVKVQVEFNPNNVTEYRLVGYDNRLLNAEDFRDDKVDAGEVGAGHSIRVLYEIVPVTSTVNANLRYQENEPVVVDEKFSNEMAQLSLRYQDLESKKVVEIQNIISSEAISVNDMSADLKFMAAVAEFGMILKNSSYGGNSTIDKAISLGMDGVGKDEKGYRREFIGLMEQYKEIITR